MVGRSLQLHIWLQCKTLIVMEFCTYVRNSIVSAIVLSLYIVVFKRKMLLQIFSKLHFFLTRTELSSKADLGLRSALGVICVRQTVCCVIPRPCFCCPMIDIFIAIS